MYEIDGATPHSTPHWELIERLNDERDRLDGRCANLTLRLTVAEARVRELETVIANHERTIAEIYGPEDRYGFTPGDIFQARVKKLEARVRELEAALSVEQPAYNKGQQAGSILKAAVNTADVEPGPEQERREAIAAINAEAKRLNLD
jgi:hypothetical protein